MKGPFLNIFKGKETDRTEKRDEETTEEQSKNRDRAGKPMPQIPQYGRNPGISFTQHLESKDSNRRRILRINAPVLPGSE